MSRVPARTLADTDAATISAANDGLPRERPSARAARSRILGSASDLVAAQRSDDVLMTLPALALAEPAATVPIGIIARRSSEICAERFRPCFSACEGGFVDVHVATESRNIVAGLAGPG
jgi:hypothetical protein